MERYRLYRMYATSENVAQIKPIQILPLPPHIYTHIHITHAYTARRYELYNMQHITKHNLEHRTWYENANYLYLERDLLKTKLFKNEAKATRRYCTLYTREMANFGDKRTPIVELDNT